MNNFRTAAVSLNINSWQVLWCLQHWRCDE